MQKLTENLYQFTIYIPPMDFTIHQYLLASDPAILFATGPAQQTAQILPALRTILNGRPLRYVFVSHMESDECGGLSVLQNAYPDVTVLCSALTARELPGFGYTGALHIGTETAPFEDGALSLQFFDYPAEVHLQNGLVCYERSSGVFYSGDLLLGYGNGAGKLQESTWADAVSAIGLQSVPSAERLTELQQKLLSITPRIAAVGHGTCMRCR